MDSLSCVGCGNKERVSKTCNRRVLWVNGASKVTNVFNAWKDILSQLTTYSDDSLSQMFGNKAFLCLPCFHGLTSYWDKKRLITSMSCVPFNRNTCTMADTSQSCKRSCSADDSQTSKSKRRKTVMNQRNYAPGTPVTVSNEVNLIINSVLESKHY